MRADRSLTVFQDFLKSTGVDGESKNASVIFSVSSTVGVYFTKISSLPGESHGTALSLSCHGIG